MLYAGVGFIQDKRFFASAPKENLAAIPDRKERFRGAHVLGWLLAILALLMFIGAFAAWDGIRHEFSFGAFFVMYLPVRAVAAWVCTML